MQQVTVRRVNLKRLEARGCRPLRRGPEGPNDGAQILRGHRARHDRLRRERERAWRQRLRIVRLAPGMRQLNGGDRTVVTDDARNAAQSLGLAVVPQPQVLRADPAARLDRGRLDDDQAGATDGATAQMHEVPVSSHPIFLADRVLAHGGNPQPVAGRDRAELQRGEEVCGVCHLSFLWSVRVQS